MIDWLPPKALGPKQRNLFLYFRTFCAKNPGAPCPIPRASSQDIPQLRYAAKSLERMGLFTIKNPREHVNNWVLELSPTIGEAPDPKNAFQI